MESRQKPGRDEGMKETEFPYEIRLAYREEWEDAMALAWKTFLEFEADDYTLEGIRSFEDLLRIIRCTVCLLWGHTRCLWQRMENGWPV